MFCHQTKTVQEPSSLSTHPLIEMRLDQQVAYLFYEYWVALMKAHWPYQKDQQLIEKYRGVLSCGEIVLCNKPMYICACYMYYQIRGTVDSGKHFNNSTGRRQRQWPCFFFFIHWHLSTHSAIQVHNYLLRRRGWRCAAMATCLKYCTSIPIATSTSKSWTSARAGRAWWSSRLRRFWLRSSRSGHTRKPANQGRAPMSPNKQQHWTGQGRFSLTQSTVCTLYTTVEHS